MSSPPPSPDILLKRLKTFDFLQGLDGDSLNRLAQNAVWKVFASDAVVFWDGDVESNLYFLQYGSLKVLKTAPDGRTQVLRFIRAGEIFNEVGVLAKRPNPASAVALEESGLWLIPRAELEGIVLAHPEVAMQIIENMADKIIELVTLATDLSLKTVEARLIKILLEQAEGDLIERRRWSNQAELAARLGTVPDVLRRAMRELTKAGLIAIDRHQIWILNRPELEARATPPPE
ncbi:MAG: Crp/Fnr family transcriptional regulator [Anaerolineales bacterium]|jgi:CRP/FNR family transcriptional regulator|nr:Crp/Fnr family transcriptional regulator [Anaerolineales bacterium]